MDDKVEGTNRYFIDFETKHYFPKKENKKEYPLKNLCRESWECTDKKKKNSENQLRIDPQNFSEVIKKEIILHPNLLHHLRFPL